MRRLARLRVSASKKVGIHHRSLTRIRGHGHILRRGIVSSTAMTTNASAKRSTTNKENIHASIHRSNRRHFSSGPSYSEHLLNRLRNGQITKTEVSQLIVNNEPSS